jgi:hypothetical protein
VSPKTLIPVFVKVFSIAIRVPDTLSCLGFPCFSGVQVTVWFSLSMSVHSRLHASEVIKNILSNRCWQNSGYPERLLQRYQEELIQSPIFRARVLSMLPKRHNGSAAPIVDPNSGSAIGSSEQLPQDVYRGKDGFLYKIDDKGKSKASENKFVIDPDAYYNVFIEECPNCICSNCPHADTCIERVRAGE